MVQDEEQGEQSASGARKALILVLILEDFLSSD